MDEINNNVASANPLDQVVSDIKQQQAQPGVLESAISAVTQPAPYAITPQEEAQINEISRQQGYDPALLRQNLLKNKMQGVVEPTVAAAEPVASAPAVQAPADVNQFDIPQQQVAPTQQAVTAPQDQTPQDVQAYLQQFKVQQGAAAEMAKAQAAEAAQKAAEYERAQNKIEATQHNLENVKNDYTKNFDNTVQEFNDASQKVKDFKFQDYWSDKTTGQKVMAGIAIMLGAYGAGLRGDNVNTGLAVINQNIDRDIQRQKMEFEKNKDAVNVAQNKFALYNQKFDNERMAELALKDNALAVSQLKLDQLSQQNKSPQILAQAKEAASKIEQQRLQAKMQFEQLARQQALLKSLGQQTSRTLSPQEEMVLAKADPDAYKVYVEQSKRTIAPTSVSPHIKGIAINDAAANEFNKYRAEVEPAIAGAQRIMQVAKDINRVTDLKKRAQIASEMKALAGQLRIPFTGPGAMTEKEFDRLMDTIGDPVSLTSIPSVQRVKLNTVLNKLRADINLRAEQAGLKITNPVKLDFKK